MRAQLRQGGTPIGKSGAGGPTRPSPDSPNTRRMRWPTSGGHRYLNGKRNKGISSKALLEEIFAMSERI